MNPTVASAFSGGSGLRRCGGLGCDRSTAPECADAPSWTLVGLEGLLDDAAVYSFLRRAGEQSQRKLIEWLVPAMSKKRLMTVLQRGQAAGWLAEPDPL